MGLGPSAPTKPVDQAQNYVNYFVTNTWPAFKQWVQGSNNVPANILSSVQDFIVERDDALRQAMIDDGNMPSGILKPGMPNEASWVQTTRHIYDFNNRKWNINWQWPLYAPANLGRGAAPGALAVAGLPLRTGNIGCSGCQPHPTPEHPEVPILGGAAAGLKPQTATTAEGLFPCCNVTSLKSAITGPAQWDALHCLPYLRSFDRLRVKIFLKRFGRIRSCGVCKSEFIRFVERRSLDHIKSPDHWRRYINDMHNESNALLGKPQWSDKKTDDYYGKNFEHLWRDALLNSLYYDASFMPHLQHYNNFCKYLRVVIKLLPQQDKFTAQLRQYHDFLAGKIPQDAILGAGYALPSTYEEEKIKIKEKVKVRGQDAEMEAVLKEEPELRELGLTTAKPVGKKAGAREVVTAKVADADSAPKQPIPDVLPPNIDAGAITPPPLSGEQCVGYLHDIVEALSSGKPLSLPDRILQVRSAYAFDDRSCEKYRFN